MIEEVFDWKRIDEYNSWIFCFI